MRRSSWRLVARVALLVAVVLAVAPLAPGGAYVGGDRRWGGVVHAWYGSDRSWHWAVRHNDQGPVETVRSVTGCHADARLAVDVAQVYGNYRSNDYVGTTSDTRVGESALFEGYRCSTGALLAPEQVTIHVWQWDSMRGGTVRRWTYECGWSTPTPRCPRVHWTDPKRAMDTWGRWYSGADTHPVGPRFQGHLSVRAVFPGDSWYEYRVRLDSTDVTRPVD